MRPRLIHFLRDTSAVAAVETALMFPVLLALMLASVDAVSYFRAARQLALRAEAASALLAQGGQHVNSTDIATIFNVAAIAGTTPETSSITLQVYTAAGSTPLLRWELSDSFDCPSPVPAPDLDAYGAQDADVVVASACMNWEPVIGTALGFEPQPLVQFAIRRSEASSEIDCSDC